jgi:thiamine-phosphate pyrophosphorylase
MTSRDTAADVGTTITAGTEAVRGGLRDVVEANFQRAEQSLRCLEECVKALPAGGHERLEQLRYRVYTLERAVYFAIHGQHGLQHVRSYVLVDGQDDDAEFSRFVGQLVDAHVDAIQLRDKKLSDRKLIERARVARQLTAAANVLLLVNDRPDVAVLCAADGVHVGQDELTVRDVRRVAGPDMLVGVSTHSLEQARQAVWDGADYIGVGPVFPSTTKQFVEYPGVELCRAVAGELSLPAFAIGGIELENVDQVLATGITRVALQGAVRRAADPADVVRRFREKLFGHTCL